MAININSSGSPSKIRMNNQPKSSGLKRPKVESQDRRRLVSLLIAMVFITVAQIGYFHVDNPKEERSISDAPFIATLTPKNQTLPASVPRQIKEEGSTIISNKPAAPKDPEAAVPFILPSQNQTMSFLPKAKSSKEGTDDQAISGADRSSTIRFDNLAFQHGPEPKFPQDFDRLEPVIDILQDTSFDLTTLRPLKLDLNTNMLGILIDAGRHYFTVVWLKRLVDVLSVLQYNLIHFRLTDDQAFAIQLESQPKLACPTHLNGNTKVYNRSHISDLIAYARQKGIAIIPEINVPGHAGAWMNIPGLVIPCQLQACRKGYAIPLNISHPDFRSILTDVIREVVDIFENPPYLHLGGDEMELAKPCFDEVGADTFDYNIFESMLKDILKDVGYPEEQVIRWRETSFAPQSIRNRQRLKAKERAGSINHWWHDTPGKTENVTIGTPIIGSARLYMDANANEAAWEVFLHSRKWWHLDDVFAQNAPVNLQGIIVGGFELDANFFHDRNVIGRMLAVTIGVSKTTIVSGNQLNELYGEVCQQVGFPDALCRKYGRPMIDWNIYRGKWSGMWGMFKKDICLRFKSALSNSKSERNSSLI